MKNENIQIEKYIGYILRIGAGIALALMASGLILSLFDNANSAATQLMKYGVLVLIVTPTIRVIASVFIFLSNKDYKFVAITVFVLFVLVIAVIFGMVG